MRTYQLDRAGGRAQGHRWLSRGVPVQSARRLPTEIGGESLVISRRAVALASADTTTRCPKPQTGRFAGVLIAFVSALCGFTVGISMLTPVAQAFPAHIFARSIGSAGAGPGEFTEPTGVAVEEVAPGSAGNVYVTDTGNNRVEWFTQQGELLGEFDGHETPEGSFAAPTEISIDNSTDPLDPSKGDIYVIDSGHDVVDKFDPTGKFVATISVGAGGEPLGGLDGVAVDPAGLLWIYQASVEIDRYSSAVDNEFVSNITFPFGTEKGFAVDSQDNLYANRGVEEIAEINSAGETLIEGFDPPPTKGVAVNQANSQVFIDNQSTVALFEASAACTASEPCASPSEKGICYQAPAWP
jgi:hypothetical protein